MSATVNSPSTPASIPQEAGGLQFALLTAVAMIALYCRMALGPLQETMQIGLRLSDNEMALLQGPALGLPMVLAAIPLGLIIDRYSRVRLLLILAVCDLAGSVLTALAPDFAVLVAARCLIGLAATATAITAFSLLADLFSPAQRGRASMVIVIGQVTGMSAAFALGGSLLAMYADQDGWRWAMLWMSAPLALAVLLALFMREPPRSAVALYKPPPIKQAIVELWRNRAVVMILAGLVMAEIAAVVVPVWSAPALSRRFALSPRHVGEIMSGAMLASGILGPIGGGFLADACQRTGGPRRTLLALGSVALLSAPAGLYAVLPSLAWAIALLVVFKTMVGAMLVMSVTLLTIAVSSDLRGFSLALMAGTNNLFAAALAPLLVSSLSEALGGPAAIGQSLAWICAAAGLLGAGLFATGRRHLKIAS